MLLFGAFPLKGYVRPYWEKGQAFQKQIGVIKELERPFWGWKGSTSATSCRSVFGGIQTNLIPKERDHSQLEGRHFLVIFKTFIHLPQPLHRIIKSRTLFEQERKHHPLSFYQAKKIRLFNFQTLFCSKVPGLAKNY